MNVVMQDWVAAAGHGHGRVVVCHHGIIQIIVGAFHPAGTIETTGETQQKCHAHHDHGGQHGASHVGKTVFGGRQRFGLVAPTAVFRKAVHTPEAPVDAANEMTRIIVGTPVAGTSVGTRRAIGVGGARIVGGFLLFLVVMGIAGRSQSTTVEQTAHDMTSLVVTAPVTSGGLGTILTVVVTVARRSHCGFHRGLIVVLGRMTSTNQGLSLFFECEWKRRGFIIVCFRHIGDIQ